MTLTAQTLTRNQFKALLLPICVTGCYWAVLIYYLGVQWSAYEQYNYGWAVPFLCGYLLYRKAETLKAEMLKSDGGKAETAGGKAETLKAETLKSDGGKAETAGGKAETLKAEMLKCGRAEAPAVGSFSAFQLFCFCLLLFLYLPTRLLHEANPIWRLTSWLWALEVIGITFLTIRLVSGQSSVISDQSSLVRGTSSRLPFQLSAFQRFSFSAFAFPICFFLVAVPWPSGLENLLTQSLMRLNSATTVELLGLFGIPAIQHGNVIEVATGRVGIDEACSGIRSFQATLMLSLFFGEVCRLAVCCRVWLVVSGFALAFVFNVGRTLFLTQIASAKGMGAIATWHDPAGVTILVACFLSLWLIARTLQKAESRKQKAEIAKPNAEMLKSEGGQDKAESRKLKAEIGTTGLQDYKTMGPGDQRGEVSGQWSVVSGHVVPLSVVSWSLAAWLVLVEGGTQLWYLSHEHGAAGTKEWSVDLDVADPAVTKVEIPAHVRGQFNADQSLEGRWQDSSGNAWQLYYFRWFPAHSLKGRFAIQLAKVHGPEICLPAAGMSLKSDLGIITVPVGGMELALRQYMFSAEGSTLHVFYGIYEAPSGTAVLANRRQDSRSRVAAALAGSRNYGQRFLEVAVVGYERAEDARAALARELEKVIEVEGRR